MLNIDIYEKAENLDRHRVGDLIILFMMKMKIREIIKKIEQDGWFMVRIKRSHRQFKHRIKKGLVTIEGHPNDDLAKGTFHSILKQAGLENEGEQSD